MTTDELRKMIASYMAENAHMTIATCSTGQPWAAVVFFAFDDDLNLYFLSDRNTRHARELSRSSKVAVTINKEWTEPAPVRGLQIEGEAQQVKPMQIPSAFAVYLKRFPGTKDFISSDKEFLKKAFTTRIYQVVPKRIWFLDEINFGPGTRKVLDLEIDEVSTEKLPGA